MLCEKKTESRITPESIDTYIQCASYIQSDWNYYLSHTSVLIVERHRNMEPNYPESGH